MRFRAIVLALVDKLSGGDLRGRHAGHRELRQTLAYRGLSQDMEIRGMQR